LVEKTTVLPDDVGTHLDATVEIEMDDGGRYRRTAREAPRTLVFQDEARATEVFEARMARSGFPSAAASRLAAEVFASARNGGTMPIRALLDRITSFQGESR
jgi:hypothetical protein